MKVLGPADFRIQPWANGRGRTVELWRLERDGALLVRLSVATVAEDGPFSLFPGIARNLTVIDGPGFRLEGEGVALDCAPLVPVAFAGDVAVRASGTAAGPSRDFNVMTSATLPRPEVCVVTGADLPAGGLLALYALAPSVVDGKALPQGHLLLAQTALTVSGLALAVRLRGLPG